MVENVIKDLVIYDLDGTLVDSAITVTKVLNSMRKKRRLLNLTVSEVRTLTSLGGKELIKRTIPCANKEIDKLLCEFRLIYSNSKLEKETVFDEVLKTLSAIKRKGCKLSICTNKPRHLAIKTLQELKLKSFFDAEICGDDTQYLKPSPKPLIELIKNFNTKLDSCCFIGDTIVDFKAAKKCGIDFILYDSGYDKELNLLYKPTRITRHSEALPYIFEDRCFTYVKAEGEKHEGSQ